MSLRKAGFTVTTAVSVLDALDKLELHAPDLIISETTFPDGDGFELRRRVRATPDWGEIPFIFLTAENAIENKIRGLELGVDDYLTKPIYIKEIITRINILLQKRQRTRFEERRDGRTRFAGRVADMPVVDVIQTIEISRKSGVIQFVGDRGRQAAIYFRDGRVIDAEAGALQGEDAVYRLLTWNEGEFEVVFRTVRRREAITMSSQGLLMEGMRRLDEWSRLLEQLPPLQHRFEVDAGELSVRLGDVPDDHNRILRLIDGKRTLLEVIDGSDLGDLECLQAISRLYFEELLVDLDHSAPARRDTGRPMPLVEVHDGPTPMEDAASGPRSAEGTASGPRTVPGAQAAAGAQAVPAAGAQVAAELETPELDLDEALNADDGMSTEEALAAAAAAMNRAASAVELASADEPEPDEAMPGALMGGYRPSSLRLIDEAVAAAQAIEPMLFDEALGDDFGPHTNGAAGGHGEPAGRPASGAGAGGERSARAGGGAASGASGASGTAGAGQAARAAAALLAGVPAGSAHARSEGPQGADAPAGVAARAEGEGSTQAAGAAGPARRPSSTAPLALGTPAKPPATGRTGLVSGEIAARGGAAAAGAATAGAATPSMTGTPPSAAGPAPGAAGAVAAAASAMAEPVRESSPTSSGASSGELSSVGGPVMPRTVTGGASVGGPALPRTVTGGISPGGASPGGASSGVPVAIAPSGAGATADPSGPALPRTITDSGLRMIGSLGRDRAEASGELVPAGAPPPPLSETQRELVTILPRRITREMQAIPMPEPAVSRAPTQPPIPVSEAVSTSEPPPVPAITRAPTAPPVPVRAPTAPPVPGQSATSAEESAAPIPARVRPPTVPPVPGRAATSPGGSGRAPTSPPIPASEATAESKPVPGRAPTVPPVPGRAAASPGKGPASPAGSGRAPTSPGTASPAATPVPGRAGTSPPGADASTTSPVEAPSSSTRLPRAGSGVVRTRRGLGVGAIVLIALAALLALAAVYLRLRRSTPASEPVAIASDAGVVDAEVSITPLPSITPDAPAPMPATGDAAVPAAGADAGVPAVGADAGAGEDASSGAPAEDKAAQARALLERANDAINEGAFERALRAADASLKLRKTARAHLTRAKALQRLERVDDALAAIAAAEQMAPRNAGVFELRGRILWAVRRREEARRQFEIFLQLEPEGARAQQIKKLLSESP